MQVPADKNSIALYEGNVPEIAAVNSPTGLITRAAVYFVDC